MQWQKLLSGANSPCCSQSKCSCPSNIANSSHELATLGKYGKLLVEIGRRVDRNFYRLAGCAMCCSLTWGLLSANLSTRLVLSELS